MAKRIENPAADDLGRGGIEFNHDEYESLLEFLANNGIEESKIAMMRECGFIAPILRSPAFEWAFELCKMQSDVTVLAICREGHFEAMRDYILFRCREGSWPESINPPAPNPGAPSESN